VVSDSLQCKSVSGESMKSQEDHTYLSKLVDCKEVLLDPMDGDQQQCPRNPFVSIRVKQASHKSDPKENA
jgi:hypothetical protein